MRKELERIEVPGEHEARERSWAVVQAAFAEREPQPPRRSWKPVAAIAIALVALAGLLSPPGRAVLDEIREVVGVEQAQPALFSLPAPGRLLVTAGSGAWVVGQDGSKRLLGNYHEASWSPFGRFVVASRRNELAALTPEGEVRWSLARPDVRFPRWGGTTKDTRIAYLSGSRLHVVGGNGRNDVDAGGMPAAAAVAPGWRPTPPAVHTLAYADTRGRVTVYEPDPGAVIFRSARLGDPIALAWSRQGTVAIATETGVVVHAGGRVLARRALPGVTALAFSPDGRSLAVLRGDELLVLDARLRAPRRVFAGAGLAGLAWSPNGRWLLIGWERADQWVFVRAAGGQKIRAISNVSSQFRSRSFPTISGWCCAP